ncbi:acylphosphatase [Namhaeicola litoreus]|uniref:acylphosphatase n=1 Tax=Namhaeicola litoreus TaxID=1052145 RepID=A0ABW3Y477_9FLAO
MEKKHFNIIVKGKVQGVWYRKFASDHALSFDLKGFVKNLNNGNVYVEVEGEMIKIEKFINLLKEGPPLAKVLEVIVQEEKYSDFEDFKISR